MTELIFYANSTLLEGPSWDPIGKKVTCVSIEQSIIYQIDPITGIVNSFSTMGPIGCVVQKGPDTYWSAEKSGIFELNFKTKARRFLVHPEPSSYMRYNDGKLDPVGRFLFGTMGFGKEMNGSAKLYSFDGNQCKKLIENITISNGIAFSPNGKSLYYIDTPLKKVAQYDYKLESGEAIFNKYIIDFVEEGLPDGMCMDVDGMLWIAEWNGSKVSKWDPESGKKISEIILPCMNVTSCCLGGENLEYLYITTAKNTERYEPLAGGLFRVKLR